jgi:hypothetical protein
VRQVQGEDVGAGEELEAVDQGDPRLVAARRARPVDGVGAEAGARHVRHPAADAAEAEDAEGLARDLGPTERRLGELAGERPGASPVQVASPGEQRAAKTNSATAVVA